jgi:hypothetical protein
MIYLSTNEKIMTKKSFDEKLKYCELSAGINEIE